MGKDLFSVCPPPLKENLALQPPQVLIFSLKLQAFICRQRRTKHIDRIHSKAANTHPAMLLLQTPLLRPALLPHRASPNKSASAMKPANQKIMVTASRPRMAHLCANCWNFMGATMR